MVVDVLNGSILIDALAHIGDCGVCQDVLEVEKFLSRGVALSLVPGEMAHATGGSNDGNADVHVAGEWLTFWVGSPC